MGTEFGEDSYEVALIVRALYGLKIDGDAFKNNLEDRMKHMVYVLCIDDPDICMKPMVIPDGDFE